MVPLWTNYLFGKHSTAQRQRYRGQHLDAVYATNGPTPAVPGFVKPEAIDLDIGLTAETSVSPATMPKSASMTILSVGMLRLGLLRRYNAF